MSMAFELTVLLSGVNPHGRPLVRADEAERREHGANQSHLEHLLVDADAASQFVA